jgi:ABC-type sulfate/molybdate transport systems ATPase subunit
VSLARALVLQPRLLLLDEPFGALDAPTRAELLAELRDLLHAAETSTLLVTHDRHEAAALADRVAILHAGTLRQLGTPGAVLDHPADADCARLLGFENVLPPAVAARVGAGERLVAVRARVVRMRPGEMTTVERVLPFGERTRIAANVDGTRVVSDVAATTLRQGDRVELHVDPSDARPIAAEGARPM